MFKFKSRLDHAQAISESYDDDKLIERFNTYCACTENDYDAVYYNDDCALDGYSYAYIVHSCRDGSSYDVNDVYICYAEDGPKSTNCLREFIDDNQIMKMNLYFLVNNVSWLNDAYDDYLETFADDDSISIQDWVENIILYHDNDDDKKNYGIDSSIMIMKVFSSRFSDIYHHSSEKQIQNATRTMHDRTDIFPDDFIEKNL